jgi:hypothetical protein
MVTHCAFSDESSHNQGRYRGLGLLTLESCRLKDTKARVAELIRESGVQEIKWQKVRDARGRFSALKLFEYALGAIRGGHFRIDVMTWDIRDQRHAIARRDDTQNLHRMYYHLFRNVMKVRWPNEAVWHLYPDENNAIDWNSVTEILSHASTRTESVNDLFSPSSLKVRLKRDFKIQQIIPTQSHLEPLVQLADLFVGIGVYSRRSFDVFREWCLVNDSEQSLFPLQATGNSVIGKSDCERCTVLNEFETALSKNRFKVSLRSSKGLRTRDPAERINFWWYEPQHSKDKAPIRKKHGV